MADMDRIPQTERFHQLGQVVGVGGQVVAVPRLTGPAVTAAVVGDAAVAVAGQEEHLVFERVGGERPAVAEDDGLPRAPVLVVDSSAVAVGDGAHGLPPTVGLGVGGTGRRSSRAGAPRGTATAAAMPTAPGGRARHRSDGPAYGARAVALSRCWGGLVGVGFIRRGLQAQVLWL